MHALSELSSVTTAYKHGDFSLGKNTRKIFRPLAAPSCNPGLEFEVKKIVSTGVSEQVNLEKVAPGSRYVY